MTYYIVEHGTNDYRLHREDGTEVATWSADPREEQKASIHTEILSDIGLPLSTAEKIADWRANGYSFRRKGEEPW